MNKTAINETPWCIVYIFKRFWLHYIEPVKMSLYWIDKIKPLITCGESIKTLN